MPVLPHHSLPVHEVPRIKTRVLAGIAHEADETAIWEQWIEPHGHIPLHYHDVEEVLLILEGEVWLTIEEETSAVTGPATIIVPPRQIHGLRPRASTRVHLLAFFPVADPQIFDPEGTVRPLPWEDVGESELPPML